MDSALQTFSSCFSWFYSYPYISSFEWKRNLTFASSPLFLLCIVCSYLLCTLFLSLLLSNRRHPIPLGLLPVLHNFILFSSSLIMFVGCTMATLSELGRLPAVTSSFTVLDASYTKRLSWNWVFCFPTGTRASGPVFFWSYVFYLSKFYELLDTFIMILKRRKLTFLHVFHHAIVIVMSFFWLEYVQSLQVIALLTNTSASFLQLSVAAQWECGILNETFQNCGAYSQFLLQPA
ncbi:hypothetical protein KP509_24G035300 [Ceratopteris richardii]|uniref:very-long-chain 3-oxoacyl-CoA synthase n=1 Tax=Ceratopteris richardii TaxID=49495 RepID=A0A8T2RTP8_CERRI|nr:hypothetical protein KP509_24G035300 [Ceratopteris richardii]